MCAYIHTWCCFRISAARWYLHVHPACCLPKHPRPVCLSAQGMASILLAADPFYLQAAAFASTEEQAPAVAVLECLGHGLKSPSLVTGSGQVLSKQLPQQTRKATTGGRCVRECLSPHGC